MGVRAQFAPPCAESGAFVCFFYRSGNRDTFVRLGWLGQIMADDTTVDAQSANKNCKVCAHEIPAKAAKCTKCESYQDWRGYIAFNITLISIITALLATSVNAIPVIARSFQNDDSSMRLRYAGRNADRGISIITINSGTRPGIVGEGNFGNMVPSDYRVAPILPKKSTLVLVPPGSAQVIEYGLPRSDRNFANYIRKIANNKRSKCQGRVSVTSFQGRQWEEYVDIPCDDLFFIMSDAADMFESSDHH
jgi:hypothetical protein